MLTSRETKMELNPNTIYEDFLHNRIDKITLIKHLTSIIENHDNNRIREDSINILYKLKLNNNNLFELFENLLISDSSDVIRNKAAKYLSEQHLSKSLSVFQWALQHEKNYICLCTVVDALVNLNSKDSKTVLIEHIKNIKKVQYINQTKGYENKKYRKTLKPIIRKKQLINYTHEHLGKIIKNFLTVKKLIEEIPNVYFELNPTELLVEKLDLSDYLEFEVKGTPWDWKNNIRDISDISELLNLEDLKKLDLSNNQIEYVEELVAMKNITHLMLSNNKISDKKNIEYLKQLPKLQFLDLSGNEIVNLFEKKDFKPDTRVLLNRYT